MWATNSPQHEKVWKICRETIWKQDFAPSCYLSSPRRVDENAEELEFLSSVTKNTSAFDDRKNTSISNDRKEHDLNDKPNSKANCTLENDEKKSARASR